MIQDKSSVVLHKDHSDRMLKLAPHDFSKSFVSLSLSLSLSLSVQYIHNLHSHLLLLSWWVRAPMFNVIPKLSLLLTALRITHSLVTTLYFLLINECHSLFLAILYISPRFFFVFSN